MMSDAVGTLSVKAEARRVTNIRNAVIPPPSATMAAQVLFTCMFISAWKWPSRSADWTDQDVLTKALNKRRRRSAMALALMRAGR